MLRLVLLVFLGQVLMVEVKKGDLLLLVVGVLGVEDEGNGQELLEVDFVVYAVLGNVVKKKLLVGQLMMKLKMVERVFEYFVINAVLVSVAFARLLPLKIQKYLFAVVHFLPLLPGRKHSPH